MTWSKWSLIVAFFSDRASIADSTACIFECSTRIKKIDLLKIVGENLSIAGNGVAGVSATMSNKEKKKQGEKQEGQETTREEIKEETHDEEDIEEEDEYEEDFDSDETD